MGSPSLEKKDALKLLKFCVFLFSLMLCVATALFADLKSTTGSLGFDLNNDGTAEVLLKADGSLGLGNLNIDQKLHVEGSAYLQGFLMLEERSQSLTPSDSGNITLYVRAGNLYSTNYLGTETGYTSAQTQWTQDAGGNVYRLTDNIGINTAAPTHKLHVVGEARVESEFSTEGNVIVANDVDVTGLATLGTISYAGVKPKRSLMLLAEGASLATSGNAYKMSLGTNHEYTVLAFDQAANETAYFQWIMPDSYDSTENIEVTLYWTATATGTVKYDVSAVGIAENEALDAAVANTQSVTKSGTANQLTSSFISGFAPNWTAGEWVSLSVTRDAVTDALAADAYLLRVKIEYAVSTETD